MSESLSVAMYIESLKRGGPEKGFELVLNTYGPQIERHIFKELSCKCYKDWGRCIDPANHKSGVTQNTFFNFLIFTNKFYDSEYKKELRNISALLYKISNHKIYEHINFRQCNDLPPNLTESVDDVGYQLQDRYSGREIENGLIFTQALESLSVIYQEALKDYFYGFSHEEISRRQGISVDASKKRRWEAIRRFRQFHGKK